MIPVYLLPLATHLWQSTLFAALAGLLTLAFRNNRAPVRYGLWMAASLKFLIPFPVLTAIGGKLAWRTAVEGAPARLSFVIQQISEPFVTAAPRQAVAVTTPEPSLVPSLLFLLWACGFLAVTAAWFHRWQTIRAAIRRGTPQRLAIPVRVVSSPMRLEPGVFGIRRPVLLLPEGIANQLTPEQLDAVLAHELCHVRRHDNLAAAVHMFVEALFWFHPLVWWIENRLVAEREQACDEAVLDTDRDPEVYAEGILNVCKLHLSSPLICMSGVAGANLKQRIEAIMSNRVTHNLTYAKKMLLAAAGVAAVTTPILIGLANAPLLPAQPQPEAPLKFEVASVKVNKDADPRTLGGMRREPGGRVIIKGAALYQIIANAYGVSFQSPRLTGAPEWTRSERYDIEANPANGAIPADLPPKEQADRMRRMLQSLLADRFQLKMRMEDKEIPVYFLTVAKSGSKLPKAKIEEKDCLDGAAPPAPGVVPCHAFNGGQGRGLHAKAASTADLVAFVENWTDRPLLDRTGLTGLYEFESDGWLPMRPRAPNPNRDPSQPPSAEELAYADPATPTLFMIFDRLGLKMEPSKAKVPVYVIESVERPSGN